MTCGSTRAVLTLFEDKSLVDSLRYNPLIFIWIFFFSISYVEFFLFCCFGKKIRYFQRIILFIQSKPALTFGLTLLFISNVIYLNWSFFI
ncbi:MAG: DUF2752 domain-containing protein [Flavobacteriales bacterium]|nr:DUF2752 domain-containing protein [Flavobacteriales bacterium]